MVVMLEINGMYANKFKFVIKTMSSEAGLIYILKCNLLFKMCNY